jgi:hypothetical protein
MVVCMLMEVVAMSTSLWSWRSGHCGASIHCPQRMVCWLIDSVWAKNFGQGLYHCHAWFFVYMAYWSLVCEKHGLEALRTNKIN